MLLFPPIKRLTTVNAALQQGIAAGQSIFALIDAPGEVDEGTQPLDSIRGDVRFEGVSFAYDAAKGEVLSDINLAIAPGECVALIGRSGSGKSTLVSLLPRFYQPQEGRILIDGQDVRQVRLADLRRQIAWVGQEVILFNDTIANNIAYGCPSVASRAAIEEAARSAHATEFIERLPDGLDTPIGDNGVLLSGGQRQRLAIARAVLKDAPILILDEATSALDTESERHVQAALNALMQDRTTLVIAHRLSTVENADRLVVLDHGRIVEQGRHQELLARGGRYAHLYELQFQQPAIATR